MLLEKAQVRAFSCGKTCRNGDGDRNCAVAAIQITVPQKGGKYQQDIWRTPYDGISIINCMHLRESSFNRQKLWHGHRFPDLLCLVSPRCMPIFPGRRIHCFASHDFCTKHPISPGLGSNDWSALASFPGYLSLRFRGGGAQQGQSSKPVGPV